MVSNDDSLVSDVQNIDTIDLDDYYIGCDSRISISSTITSEMIKYWINVQNDLIVQRYLSLKGSAAIGDVSIEFSPTDSIKHGVAVNGAIDSYKSILKTISNSQLDYTENNVTINGWIIDYLKSTTLRDISNAIAHTEAYGSGFVNIIDTDISTSGNYTTLNYTGEKTVLILDLLEQIDIDIINIGCYYKTHSNGNASNFKVYTSTDNVSYALLFNQSSSSSTYAWFTLQNLAAGLSNIRYIKFTCNSGSVNWGSAVKIHNMSIEL